MTLNEQFYVFKPQIDIQKAFDDMARYIFERISLQAGAKEYLFTEIEFYYYSPQHKHRDPFCKRNPVHARETQCPEIPSDKLFFHYSGVDICFDNKDRSKQEYGGILIRGIKEARADGTNFINGPLKTLCRLLNDAQQTGDVRICLKKAKTPRMLEHAPKSSARIGLKAPLGDAEKQKYKKKKYRYYLPDTKGIKKPQ